ncbi:MAG: hypothetical protein ACFCD0_29655 [Gemmataceae bacterium]
MNRLTKRHQRQVRFLILGLFLLPLTGCGDTPAVIFRESIICRSEFADGLSKIQNDNQAGLFMETTLVLLQFRWASIEERSKHMFDVEKDEEKEKLGKDYLVFLDEDLEAEQRVRYELARLIRLRGSLYAGYKYEWSEADPSERGPLEKIDTVFPNLTKLLNEAPDDFMPDRIWSENPFLREIPDRPSLKKSSSSGPGGGGGPMPDGQGPAGSGG